MINFDAKIITWILKADEGKLWTNGEIYSDLVILSHLDNPDDWEEITVEEAMARQESEVGINDEIMV